MGLWNAKRIVEKAKKDFEGTWTATKKLVPASSKKGKSGRIERGTPHAVYETASMLREAYLNMGFEEIINPLFIEDTEVHKQFGPEAVTVLDRVYYLGGLPRPDIGISDKKLKQMEKLNLKPDREAIQQVLRRYKLGELSGDDMVSELSKRLNTDDSTSLTVLEQVFPEFRELKPEASNMTLRSHMTSGWFLTLAELYGKKDLPFRLFSIDRCYRREQSEDRGHLRTYYSASSVVLGEDVSLHDGEDIAKGLLKGFGFRDFKFAPDEKRSKYYAPDTQTEVFGLSPNGEWVEIATFGIYSPVALSRYDIEHPVLNLGLGVERLAMVLSGAGDIRELVYPQFYGRLTLSDADIASGIELDRTPETEDGRAIAEAIVRTATEHANEPGPCSFEAYRGGIFGREVTVRIMEVEDGTRLLGPAALNEVVVYDGSIYGVSPEKGPAEALKKGTPAGITYLQAIAGLAAREIEEAAKDGRTESLTKVKGVKLPSDVNLKISDRVLRFINSHNKKIDIRGPVFTTIKAEFS